MTKEEIIKLAKEKKFVSAELCNNPYKYSTHEDMRWLFWLVEIQKWLLDNHKLFVRIEFEFSNLKWYYKIFQYNIGGIEIRFQYNKFIEFEFNYYNEALEAGVVKALKLIP